VCSRSHAFISVEIPVPGSEVNPQQRDSGWITFVDLAGQERAEESRGDQEEAKSINENLSALNQALFTLNQQQALAARRSRGDRLSPASPTAPPGGMSASGIWCGSKKELLLPRIIGGLVQRSDESSKEEGSISETRGTRTIILVEACHFTFFCQPNTDGPKRGRRYIDGRCPVCLDPRWQTAPHGRRFF
jgi:hypothetical protein